MEQQDAAPRLYGYRIERGVLFEYELNEDANLVTDPVTGARFRFNPTTFFRAALAGDFNGWTQISMGQNPRVPYQFQVLLPFEQFPKRLHLFKFVIDGSLWVEPPPYASNTVDAGISYDAKNLVLYLDDTREL
jgi:hypothetical protein